MKELQYPLDGAHILQKKRSLKKSLIAQSGLIDKKIAILSGSTVGDVKAVLELFLLNLGIRPTFWEGGYGLFYENLVFDDGSLAAFAPDIIYIHTSNKNLRAWPLPSDDDAEAEACLQAEIARFASAWQAAAAFNCPVIQNNFEDPLWRNFGNLDATSLAGRVRFARRLNEHMANHATTHPAFFVHDLAYLAATAGLDSWCCPQSWYAYKYLCAPDYIPTLCHSLASLIGSLFGRAKKALVLDLDNTLWGGIIGEVGENAIELGDETPMGMAYAEFQTYLKMLSGRGILLNVASKNEEANALAGFALPHSPLKREDFLCFEANWQPKSQSVASIAQTLNIGTDSLVFVDDNPAEREIVRQALPEVSLPEITSPEHTIRLIDRAGWFEASILSSDDINRGEMYKQNTARLQQEDNFLQYEDYLLSLDMTAHITPFQQSQLDRITQLVNKTNQFNLTTRRYTAAEAEACSKNSAYITLSGQLQDKFGDNGLTSAIIGKIEGQNLNVELWIMSCRVFKRHLEYAMFDALVAQAQKQGLATITGSYLPTAKNLLTQDFYATIGFNLVSETAEERRFIYHIQSEYTPKNQVIHIEEN